MKIAIVYNIDKSNVIHKFGMQNKEMYFRGEIDTALAALRTCHEEVIAFEGDKDIIAKLDAFLSPGDKNETPQGVVFNLAYGIQGNSRYTHVPAILEMMGVPYTGSGPLAHSIALDKEMTKIVLAQAGLPTAKFVVVQHAKEDYKKRIKALNFPLIVKPKDEAGSFGICSANDFNELETAIDKTFEEYQQAILVEEYLEGREFNVAVMGNGESIETLEPLEVVLGDKHLFQTYAGKKSDSYPHICPADIPKSLSDELQCLAIQAFNCIKCADYARIDYRLDKHNKPHILELNSMAAIHSKGSFFIAAKQSGYTYPKMINHMVDVALKRYALKVPVQGSK